MAEIIKTYTQDMPATRFIGICYQQEDSDHGSFGARWCECFENGLFAKLEALTDDTNALFEDSGAYIGLMRWKEGEPFQYWIGMFLPPNTAVPDGCASVDFDASCIGIAWLRGKEPDIYGEEEKCFAALQGDNVKLRVYPDGANWFMERYACPRFTQPDGDGNVVLDVCFFAE